MLSDQAKLLPVKSYNLPDICPMTGCYLQACNPPPEKGLTRIGTGKIIDHSGPSVARRDAKQSILVETLLFLWSSWLVVLFK